MAEPFKNLINVQLLAAAGARLKGVWPEFERESFFRQAAEGLDTLELKARAMQVCAALEATLPEDFGEACNVIETSLAPPWPDERASSGQVVDEGLSGWILWPVGEFIARRGQGDPERALHALRAITQRFTAEFAIRPFIVNHPARVFAMLESWLQDPSAHVRRLVSEGSRPRLPWGLQLKSLIQDPSPTLPLLRALQDDPSEYVRRSVANHLNDIAKDHPGLVASWLQQHLPDAPPARRAMLRHASRMLIKKGDPAILAAWGLDKAFKGEVDFQLTPKKLNVGDSLTLALTLRSSARRAQKLAIDYLVHHVKADGRTTPKVFKGWTLELAAGDSVQLGKQHSMRTVTTRRYHAGAHAVEVQINGRVVASAPFALRVPDR
jgi:3-methyladenine DNA glycosylase AlkC